MQKLVALEEMLKLDQEQVDYIVAKASAVVPGRTRWACHTKEETGRVFEDKATKNGSFRTRSK